MTAATHQVMIAWQRRFFQQLRGRVEQAHDGYGLEFTDATTSALFVAGVFQGGRQEVRFSLRRNRNSGQQHSGSATEVRSDTTPTTIQTGEPIPPSLNRPTNFVILPASTNRSETYFSLFCEFRPTTTHSRFLCIYEDGFPNPQSVIRYGTIITPRPVTVVNSGAQRFVSGSTNPPIYQVYTNG